ncbi:MAG: hypothetical protein R3C56_28330 [Pirellulaceae bacterium]
MSASGQSKQIAIDRLDEQSLASAVEKLCHSAVDVITVMDEAISWDLQETLAEVARDNRLCELLFLIAKQENWASQVGRC